MLFKKTYLCRVEAVGFEMIQSVLDVIIRGSHGSEETETFHVSIN
jgi:hypothetical protein